MKKTTSSSQTSDIDTSNRGQLVHASGDMSLVGRVVGVAGGVRWVAWPGNDYEEMCRNFDRIHL